MLCIISYTDSTRSQDFYALGADAKVGRKTPRKARVDSFYIDVGEMV